MIIPTHLRTTGKQNLTFERIESMRVLLDGKYVGDIRFDHLNVGYRYWPKGRGKNGGELFATIAACQESLQ